MSSCVIPDCREAADPGAPLPLCTRHLLAAHDWVVRDVGVTDTLPSPCVACGSRVGVKYPSGWICATCEWKVGELPDSSAIVPFVEVVYYIRWRDRIKIGTTANPRMRLAALPHDEVLAFERGGRWLEQRRHLQFAEHRMPGSEWFHVHDALIEHVASVGAGIENPWARYALWVSREVGLRE
ncbi:MAG: ATPase [Rhodoglobus sp.]|nr:ATPase [Rhodoglobus sp.]